MPDAQPGVVAYITCSTQWSAAGMGGRTGLRYADCLALLASYLPGWKSSAPQVWRDIELPALMQDVQIIETAFLAAWGEKSEADAATRKASHGSHH